MASETVRIFVVDEQTPTPEPIEDVLVRVFDDTGSTFISQDYTDGDGIADFTLDGDDPPVEYIIRLSKTGVAFDGNLGDGSKSPQIIDVYSPNTAAPNGSNDFELRGQTFSRPVSSDPRLCRVSGFFKRADGLPYVNLDLIFTPRFKPAIVDESSVMWGPINARTDADGYVELDLYRMGEYSVLVETLEDQALEIVVPDLSSFNLVSLLFPVVEQVIFNPAAISLGVGEEVFVTPSIYGSDMRLLEGTSGGDVIYTIGDEVVATVSVKNDYLVITGVTPGYTTLGVDRLDESIVIIPDDGIIHIPLAITVHV